MKNTLIDWIYFRVQHHLNGGKQGVIEIKKSDNDITAIAKKNGHLIVVSFNQYNFLHFNAFLN